MLLDFERFEIPLQRIICYQLVQGRRYKSNPGNEKAYKIYCFCNCQIIVKYLYINL